MTTNTTRSGYARDIMPERLDADEKAGKTVPIASEAGVQEGRVPPAQRTYGKAQYRVVELSEADRLTHLRTTGALPRIPGGLDDTGRPPEQKGSKRMKAAAKKAGPVAKDYDPLGDKELEPGDPALVAEEERLQRQFGQRQNVAPAVAGKAAAVGQVGGDLAPTCAHNSYLYQRKRVTLELVDGAMGLSAIDVKQTKFGVTVLLPMSSEGMTFIPKPGSEITVVAGDNRWPCFFPGTYFELEELGIVGLTFVKAEEQ